MYILEETIDIGDAEVLWGVTLARAVITKQDQSQAVAWETHFGGTNSEMKPNAM